MKRPILLALAVAGACLALAGVLYAFSLVFASDLPSVESRREEVRASAALTEERLLLHMILFQRYLEKADLAADAEAWDLATFYTDKLEQNAVRVVDGGYVKDGLDVSAIAAEVAVPRARRLAEAARQRDRAAFDPALAAMVEGCNACHKRSGHRFVQIVVPDGGAPPPSQRFSPL